MRREAPGGEKGHSRKGLGARIRSFSRVMQQGQPDDEEKELGASGREKTSITGGNLSGEWVLKDWGTGSFISEWPGMKGLVRSRRRKTKTEERAGGRVKRRADGPEGGAPPRRRRRGADRKEWEPLGPPGAGQRAWGGAGGMQGGPG